MSISMKMNSLCLFLAASFVLPVFSAAGDGKSVKLAENGRCCARIVIAAKADGQVRKAAETLKKYIAEATGADIPLVKDTEAGKFDGTTIEVGKTSLADTSDILPKSLDGDGFVIKISPPDNIVIVGPTAWGTEFGVYEFLERFLGVRWLMPGEHGTDVPRNDNIAVPEGTIIDEPVFFSRHMVPIWEVRNGRRGRNQEQANWMRFNRMRSKIDFHHNLYTIFPMEKYAASHPEFYPVLNGKRQTTPPRPRQPSCRWQPCFSARDSAKEAAKNIVEYFDKHPEATSFSLGVNDAGGFCQCKECLARVSEEKARFNLYDNYSDLYYVWTGQVIDEVLKKYPDKWFGGLAYREIADPPKHCKVHPRLVMFDCHERMFWVNPRFAEEDKEFTRAWARAAENFAWYDYVYGVYYQVPRVYSHLMGEYLRFAADAGIKAHYAETTPSWGEGAKLYIYLKLWWNPRQDIDKLLDEWYERAVGPKAAPYLAQYYEMWEKFWTRDILKSGWFPLAPRIYMAFNNPGYLADVNPEYVVHSRKLLEKVLKSTETEAQSARAGMIMSAFEFYEISVAAYQGHRKILEAAPPATEAEALAILDDVVSVRQLVEKRKRLVLKINEKPHLINQRAVSGSLSGDSWGLAGLEAVAHWVAHSNKAVIQQIKNIAENMGNDKKLQDAARKVLAAPLPDSVVFPPGGNWRFKKDPDGTGLSKGWYGKTFDDKDWRTIKVPAYWSETWVGNYLGYGWYRVYFETPGEASEGKMLLRFEGVDEQAWVFVNGKLLTEHTLLSEQIGYAICSKPFTVEIPEEYLNPPGKKNLLAVLVHAHAFEGGIWRKIQQVDNKNN